MNSSSFHSHQLICTLHVNIDVCGWLTWKYQICSNRCFFSAHTWNTISVSKHLVMTLSRYFITIFYTPSVVFFRSRFVTVCEFYPQKFTFPASKSAKSMRAHQKQIKKSVIITYKKSHTFCQFIKDVLATFIECLEEKNKQQNSTCRKFYKLIINLECCSTQ